MHTSQEIWYRGMSSKEDRLPLEPFVTKFANWRTSQRYDSYDEVFLAV